MSVAKLQTAVCGPTGYAEFELVRLMLRHLRLAKPLLLTGDGGDLGFVGEISSVGTRWIEAIWERGGIPAISSLAPGSDGEYYT